MPTGRRDAGTLFLGHASSPSMGRSVADFLSAHVPRKRVPASRLDFVGSQTLDGFEIEEQSGDVFSYSHDYHINSSSVLLHNAGTDGTDIGI